jgi:hypothetical protein
MECTTMSRANSVRPSHLAQKKKTAQIYNEVHRNVRPPAPYLPIPKGHCYIEGNLVKRILT